MYEASKASLTGTYEALARLSRCTPAECTAAISELQAANAADVQIDNGRVTITCRRVSRVLSGRELTKARVAKHRQGVERDESPTGGNGSVTPDVTPLKRPCNAASSELSSDKDKDNERVRDSAPAPAREAVSDPTEDGPLGEVPNALLSRMWDAYPRKQGRDAAWPAMRAAVYRACHDGHGDPLQAARWIISRVLAYARSPAATTTPDRYIPNPEKWFREGRYNDPDETWNKPYDDPSNQPKRPAPHDAAAARRAAQSEREYD